MDSSSRRLERVPDEQGFQPVIVPDDRTERVLDE
jgi:hypothetical protein